MKKVIIALALIAAAGASQAQVDECTYRQWRGKEAECYSYKARSEELRRAAISQRDNMSIPDARARAERYMHIFLKSSSLLIDEKSRATVERNLRDNPEKIPRECKGEKLCIRNEWLRKGDVMKQFGHQYGVQYDYE